MELPTLISICHLVDSFTAFACDVAYVKELHDGKKSCLVVGAGFIGVEWVVMICRDDGGGVTSSMEERRVLIAG